MTRRVVVTVTIDIPEKPAGGWSTLASLTSTVKRLVRGKAFSDAVLRSLTWDGVAVDVPRADWVDVRHQGHLPALVAARYEDGNADRLIVLGWDRDRVKGSQRP